MIRQSNADKLFGQVVVGKGSYVDPRAVVIGTVIIESGVYVAPGAIMRADASAPYRICEGTNVQDLVNFHASKGMLREFEGRQYANYVGRYCSLAHGSRVHFAILGNNCFLGMGATLLNAVLGENCFVGHHSLVEDVEIPAGRYVKPFTYIDKGTDVSALPEVPPEAKVFQAHVLEENRGILDFYLSQMVRL